MFVLQLLVRIFGLKYIDHWYLQSHHVHFQLLLLMLLWLYAVLV